MTTQSETILPVTSASAQKPKTILITGGAGFIGSNFVTYLYNRYPDYKIVVVDALTYAGNLEYFGGIDRSHRFNFHYGDIRNRDLMQRLVGEADIVVHFAAESHVSRSIADQASAVSTDVVGTDVVASCVVKHRQTVERFVHISTSEVYGTAVRPEMDESHPLNPCSPYAGAKAGADRLVYSYLLTYELPGIIIRPFNNFGPRQHLEKLVPRLITSAIMDEPMTIHGDGSAARDWLFVEDHCRALDEIIHAPLDLVAGEVFNIGTGHAGSILDVAKLVASKLNYDLRKCVTTPNRPGQVQLHRANVDKIARVLGFRATTSLSDGLDKTIDWYLKNESIWRKQLWLRDIEIETAEGTVVH